MNFYYLCNVKKNTMRIMKKILILIMMFVVAFNIASAQQPVAQISFDKVVHDFGTFNEDDGAQKCEFTFTNTGDAPLVINQAVASCGCTVPSYTKTPIQPGEQGEIKVTYNGKGKFPGHFKKTITIRSNAETEMVRLYIEGNMEEKAKN